MSGSDRETAGGEGVPPAGEGVPAVEMMDVHAWFGDLHVLKGINLKAAVGERIVICGPSGSGKSTLIRCINRLIGRAHV